MKTTQTLQQPRWPGWKDNIRRTRRLLREVLGRGRRIPVQVRCAKQYFGNEHAEWCVCPDGLSEESIVYSFGVGTDISFDLELIRRFGMRVDGFDPTPRAIAWLRSQDLPEKFVFHDYGIGGHDGNVIFRAPQDPSDVSYRVVPHGSLGVALIEAPVQRLESILKNLGHQKIDVLKMDIEGAEYDVVEDLLSSQIPVKQLLVEFHHSWQEIGMKRTQEAVSALNQAGYKIFYVSPSGTEFSFVKS
jgi:FkbM family methyltransferase